MSFYFLNTALLAGAAAAVVPVLIHLLHRRKAEEDLLPTLRFLKKSLTANRRRTRIRHLLVLLLRVLAVLLIVATLARPAYVGALFFREGTAPVAAVIVVDNSASMAYRPAGKESRFDRARAQASKAARALPAGSRAALVVTGLGPSAESLDREFTFNAASLSSRIRALEISAYGGDVGEALARAYAVLAQETRGAPAAAGREVYVAGDLARHAWASLAAAKPPPGTATFVIDVGAEADENFSVENVAAHWRNDPSPHVELTATFRSGSLATSRLVEVHFDGAKRAERVLELPADSITKATFKIPVLNRRPPLQGWVSLRDRDPVIADNSRYFTLPQNREIRCLVIHDSHAPPGEPDTGFFLRNALEPPALKGATQVSVTSAGAAAVTASDFARKDVLILADVAAPSRRLLDAVEAFSRAGGGALVFLGHAAEPRAYRNFLVSCFGVAPGPARSAPPGRGARLAVLSFDHPIFKAFHSGRNGNLAAARFYRWRALQPLPAAEAPSLELARFDSGDPAVLAWSLPEGALVLAAFSPVSGDTDIILRASFIPLVHEMTRYAAATSAGPLAFRTGYIVGEPVGLPVEKAGASAHAEIRSPLGRRPLELSAAPGAGNILFTAFFPGNYTAAVTDAAGLSQLGFSVNLDPSESRLERISPEEIESALPGSVVVRRLSNKRVREARGPTRGAREMFDLFLVLAVALLALEAYVANRFYRESGAA